MQLSAHKKCIKGVVPMRPLYTGTSYKHNVKNDFCVDTLQAKVRKVELEVNEWGIYLRKQMDIPLD